MLPSPGPSRCDMIMYVVRRRRVVASCVLAEDCCLVCVRQKGVGCSRNNHGTVEPPCSSPVG